MHSFWAIRVLVTSVHKFTRALQTIILLRFVIPPLATIAFKRYFRVRRQIVNLFAPGEPHEGDCSHSLKKMQKMKIFESFQISTNFQFFIKNITY